MPHRRSARHAIRGRFLTGAPLPQLLPGQYAAFRQVTEDLTAAIKDGRLARGAQLPSIRQHALRLLRERKPIVSWQGRGSFVCEEQSQPAEAGAVTYEDLVAHLAAIRADLARLTDRVAELESKVDKL